MMRVAATRIVSSGSWKTAFGTLPVLMSALTPVLMSLMVLVGCGRSPDVRHYVLGSTVHETPARGAAGEHSLDMAVLVGPIRVPEYLDRPQIARRKGGGEIGFDEFNRWLGGFEDNLTTGLATQMRSQLGSVRIVGYPSSPPFEVEYDVRIHVDEWLVDESNSLRVAVRFAIAKRGSDMNPLLSGYEASIDVANRSTRSLVAAHDRALGELAMLLSSRLAEAAESR